MHDRFSRQEKVRNAVGATLVAVGSLAMAAFSWPAISTVELLAYGGGAIVFGLIALSFLWSLREA